DPYGDFVNIDKQKRIWAQNVTVRDSTFARSGRQGMSITGARSVVIEHNHITDVARSTFDVEPDGARGGARDVTIRDNDIGPTNNRVLASAGRPAPVDGISFEDNRLTTILNVQVITPVGSRRSNIRIVGNRSSVTTNHAPVVTLARVDGGEISGNHQEFVAGKTITDAP